MSPSDAIETDHEWIMARAEEMLAKGETPPRLARDAVNQPMINNWIEAMGDTNPIYVDSDLARQLHGGPVAPTAMAQVWTMYGLDPERPSDDPLHGTMAMLDKAGFTSVLGTNCDQTYARYLREGDHVSITTKLESVVGPKMTGVGEGYFVTTQNIWRVGDEVVATMKFRVLKFRPGSAKPAVDKSKTIRPQMNRDTQFFWEGTRIGELRIQRCNACGEMRHPPGPVCPSCHAMDRGYVVASGRGTVYSWIVHHAPQVPGKELPLRLAVVDLPEGVKMIGELRDEVEIGGDVEAVFERIDDEVTLIHWRAPVAAEPVPSQVGEGVPAPVSKPEDTLPEWSLPITRTLIVSGALATRDFQDVHHDPELSKMRGTKDIFPNILTTTGLVQRYVTEWAGWDARVTACALKLGAPAYPGDTMTFTGSVSLRDGKRLVVDVVGIVPLGNHVNATVTLELP